MPSVQINQISADREYIFTVFLYKKRNKSEMIYGTLKGISDIFRHQVPLQHLDGPLDEMPTSSAII